MIPERDRPDEIEVTISDAMPEAGRAALVGKVNYPWPDETDETAVIAVYTAMEQQRLFEGPG